MGTVILLASGADVDTMIVAIAATHMELAPLCAAAKTCGAEWPTLVTGVGPVETAVVLGRYLAEHSARLSGVLQFGVGGAYLAPEGAEQVQLLEVCLAEREVLGDLGICMADRIEYFSDNLGGPREFSLRSPLLGRAEEALRAHDIDYHLGTFVTVNCVSATNARGEMLSRRWQGLCENMEGGAAARLCGEYGLPLVEMRVISNLVEERNIKNWQLQKGCERAAEIAALLMKELL